MDPKQGPFAACSPKGHTRLAGFAGRAYAELGLVEAGDCHWFPLGQGWNQRSSTADSVRELRCARGGHLRGLCSPAPASDLVGYESWLERDRLILLDREPEVIGMASQPDGTADRISPRV